MQQKEIIIREANDKDLLALASLMNELGYPTLLKEMEERFNYIKQHEDYKTFVAEYGNRTAGMIGLIKNAFYEKNGLYIRVAALVVGTPFRYMGIGKKLIQKAEDWANEIGTDTLIVNSGDREERRNAHIFYQRLGFEQKSIGFVKKIN